MVCLPVLLAACGTLPASGPRGAAVVGQGTRLVSTAERPAPPVYALLTLDTAVVGALAEAPAAVSFSPNALEQRAADIRLLPGDIVSVTIFESQAGGLFIPAEAGARPGNFVQLAPQQIDLSGNISIPFAGAIRAAGRSPAQLQASIAARLERRALEPQALVTVAERRGSGVSVLGDVGQPLRFTLDPGGERLLGALARAGGPRSPSHETLVVVQRDGRLERAMLSDIAADPRLNLQLMAGDSIIVSREQRFFIALGAVGQTASITQLNRRFPFEAASLSLADAVARAGGLQDDRANPSEVFLFRSESRAAFGRMGFAAEGLPETVPTVYRADLSNPASIFLAQRFPLRADDLLYVSTSAQTEILKFLQVVLPISQIGANIRLITNRD